MTSLIYNIKTIVNTRDSVTLLRGAELSDLPCLHNAYIITEDDEIADVGLMSHMMFKVSDVPNSIDASGRLVLPGWCDSHTHLVYAGSRENEFVDKIKGLSYAEIAARGGGISNTARIVNETSEEQLFAQSYSRLQQVMALGTGAIEIKSGYGLTVEGELKMLRVIKRLKEQTRLMIKSSFLGAHTIPAEFKESRESYIQLIIDQMLPMIEQEKLADYIDVFCDEGFFSAEETILLCNAGKARGLKPKIHANQLAVSGGVQAGIQVGAVSVDHLEHMDEDAISSLANSSTIGTLLPTAAFFLRMPYQPAR
ncbi:MAG TPA: imidazolonepropionase, partial [Chitinophagaceae bacterium]|nr:imidazolonepropionase [Chitinophagaceae bacterium]